MFSGIIKSLGVVYAIHTKGSTKRITIVSSISDSLHTDQSVAHDGVCLTVVAANEGTHEVEVVLETCSKTTFGFVRKDQVLNLETSVTPSTLLDGHIVQGHTDTLLQCLDIRDMQGSWMMRFSLPQEYAALVIPQGAICINGVSLTIARLERDAFEVAIIPYTFANTNLKLLHPGTYVNIEFDVIGKYLLRQRSL